MEATQSTKSLPSTDVDEKLVNRCPFPGIPARATARSSKDDAPISWSTKRSFDPDERLVYTCDVKSKMASDQNDTITCGADGAWIGSLPRCGRSYLGFDLSSSCLFDAFMKSIDRLMELSDWRIRYTKSGFIWIAIKRKERPCSKLYRARKFHLSSSADEGQGVTEVTVQACYSKFRWLGLKSLSSSGLKLDRVCDVRGTGTDSRGSTRPAVSYEDVRTGCGNVRLSAHRRSTGHTWPLHQPIE